MSPVAKSTLIMFSLVASVTLTNAEPIKRTFPDGSFTLAQTQGMERRQDRRDTRQDCRQEGGLVGADKRNCKQEGRSDDDTSDKTGDQDTGK